MEFTPVATQEMTVSYGSSLDAKELVRQTIDIVDLVGKHVQLQRQGRNYVGLCPWHDDSRPSLQVNPERQSFKCWVCDIGGDIFDFTMKIEGVTFPEALAMLADQAGVQLKPQRPRSGNQATGGTEKQSLYQAMVWAEKQYHEALLRAPEAEVARQYLARRGISSENIETFHLGFCPNQRDWMLQRVGQSESRVKVLETIGLLARSTSSNMLYDRFRGRVLFSIRDSQGRPVGFGGRVLPETGNTSPAKYINSPETPLFRKSELLYGLDVASTTMRKSRTALVMEGYTDCIMAHQYGFRDAIAVLGTALNESHIRILKRFADRIVLVLDGDEAGQRRANEILPLFVAQQVDLRILTLPEKSDPCDYLQQHGAEAFADLLATKAVDVLEHAFQAETRGLDLDNDIHGASQALERLITIIAKAPRLQLNTTGEARFREEKILQRLSARFRVPESELRARLTQLRTAAKRRPSSAFPEAPPSETSAQTPTTSEVTTPWQRELLEIVISSPDLVPTAQAAIPIEKMAAGPYHQIYSLCCRLSEAGTCPTFDRLMLELDDTSTKSLLVELDEDSHNKGVSSPADLLEELIENYRREELNKQYPAWVDSLRDENLDEGQKENLLNDLLRELRARHGGSDPTEG